jgi:hypothetical protein
VRLVLPAVVGLLLLSFSLAQSTGTGSIVGAVTDAKGTAIAGAKVEITDKAKGAVIHETTSSAGLYSSGPIQPGNYVVRVEMKGFHTAQLALVVPVGNTVNGSVALQIGIVDKVEVPHEAAFDTDLFNVEIFNIEQGTVQSVVNPDEISKLPINGRNFLDLVQLEPGIQMQDGSLFENKDGISSISFLSRYGRAERVDVDGVDISDEITGSATQNIPTGAVQEFQLAQSLLDLSTGLTSSGAVNLITQSGSDQIHGGVFGLFRGKPGAAELPGSTYDSFQRELFGGNAGGAFIKKKAFWFADAERTQQNLTALEPFSYPFDGLDTILSQPYREFDTDERVDWNMRGSTRAFYRFNFFENSDYRPYGTASSTQQVRNIDNTATNALGVDFNTGVYAHSLRFEYLKFRNEMTDDTSGLSAIDNPIPGLGINIGASINGNCVLSNGGSFCGGPSWLAPQQSTQSNEQAKYDGSRVWGAHILRYGAAISRIDGARLAAYATFPQVGTNSIGASVVSDPTAYAANWVSLGNGIGSSTAKSEFGFPGGGFAPDNRVELYVGDRWELKPRVTLTYGLHYVHDTGRTDTGLGALPDLNQWGPGLGDKVRNPGLNFAPQFGFAWDAGGTGKTIVRGGAGLFYENQLWNNATLDSPSRLAKGIFADSPTVCQEGMANPFVWPTSLAGMTSIAGGAGTVVNTPTGLEAQPTFCGGTISTVAPLILALSSAYQAASATVTGSQPNSNFVGTSLTALNPSYDLFYPNFRTPRSWEMNLGLQKEIRPGTVLSLDYVRNVGQHLLIGEDVNHSGAARSFNQANAVAARDAAQEANGCPAGLAQAACMIGNLGLAGAQAAYSSAGLDSNLQSVGGGPCTYCAFPGTNPITGNIGAVGGVDMLYPNGTSLYSSGQLKIFDHVEKPVRLVKAADFQFSYALSRFVSQVQDQDFVNLAIDNDDLTRFTGPNAMDRKHQISLLANFDLPFNLKFSMIGHFYSPLPQSLELPELTNGGEIFATDWLGSGLNPAGSPEPLPGTEIGQFEHHTDILNLRKVITTYNHVYAEQLTPAGDCLVANNAPNSLFRCPGQVSATQVMTYADMEALGWAMPNINSVAPGAVGIPWLKTLDMRVSWPIKIKDRVTIEPSASAFNVLNFVNLFAPGNLPAASLLPGQNGLLAPNVVGGVTSSTSTPFRTSFQSGTNSLGAPRQFEFGLRIIF